MTRRRLPPPCRPVGCPPKLVIQITDIGKRFSRRCMRCQLEELYSGGASRMGTSTDTIMAVALHGIGMSAAQRRLALGARPRNHWLRARRVHGFSGLATVPLQAPDRAAAVLQRALGRGLKGALIYSNVAGGHLDEPSRRAFFDAAAAMDAPIMLHPTYPLCAPSAMAWGLMEMVAFLFDTTTAALRLVLDGLYDRHPDFRFLVPHNGSFIPYVVGRIDMIAEARPAASGAIQVPP